MEKILYHDHCVDVFCTAWLFSRLKRKNITYIPVNYGEEPPWNYLTENDDVYILDFSYKRSVMESIISHCKRVTCLDHHITAQKELEGLAAKNLYLMFDMEKSGAMLTQEYLKELLPKDYVVEEIVKYVQDRDLWKFELFNSKEVNAAIQSYPFDFSIWNKFIIMDL